MPSPRLPSVVGQVTTIVRARASSSTSRVGRRGSRARRWSAAPRKPQRSSSSIGEQPCSASALLELAALLAGVDVADQPVALGVLGHRGDPLRRHGADAVHGHPHRHAVDRPAHARSRVEPLQERLHVGIAEAPLARGRPARRSRRGGRRPAAARSPARSSPPPRPGRSPSRWARRRASRRAGARRSETRPPRRSRRRPSARRRARRPRASTPGRASRPAGTSRSASSRSRRRTRTPTRSPIPRRSSWKAWLWALTIAGTRGRPHAPAVPRHRRHDPSASRTYTGSPATNATATGLRPSR